MHFDWHTIKAEFKRRPVPTVATLVGIFLCFHVPALLIEHAVAGYINEEIANLFGLSRPSVEQIVSFGIKWILPLFAAGLVGFILLHFVSTSGDEAASPIWIDTAPDLAAPSSPGQSGRILETPTKRERTTRREARFLPWILFVIVALALASLSEIVASQNNSAGETRAERDRLKQQLAASQRQLADAKNRIGPQAAMSMANELAFSGVVTTMPKTFVVVTAAPGNEIFERDITNILNEARGMSGAKSNLLPMGLPDYQRDLDAPRLEERGVRGITIHGRNEAGNFLMQVFSNCFATHQTGDAPEALLEYQYRKYPTTAVDTKKIVWIEVGEGSPWIQSACNN